MAMLAVRLEPKERLRRTLGPCTCVTKIGRFLRQSISKMQREMTKFYVLGERKPVCGFFFIKHGIRYSVLGSQTLTYIMTEWSFIICRKIIARLASKTSIHFLILSSYRCYVCSDTLLHVCAQAQRRLYRRQHTPLIIRQTRSQKARWEYTTASWKKKLCQGSV